MGTTLKSFIETIHSIFDHTLNHLTRLVLLGLTLLLALWFGWHSLFHPFGLTTEAAVRNLIVSGVQNANELTTATSTIKATVVLRQVTTALNLPVGNTNLVYEGVGQVRAGISLTDLQIQKLNSSDRQIEISLPTPRILDVSLDLDRSSTLANYRHWLGAKAGAELYEVAQQKAIAEIREQAETNHILDIANHNAEQILSDILSKAGFQTIQVNQSAQSS